jgi:ATP-dependent protease ClpP protease subunit
MTVNVPDADFTPNPDRAIWIDGEINKALEDRLRPRTLELTSHSREPISIFIDSDGGSPAVGDRIMSLLRSAEDGAPASRIITVALSKAQSTAADLLSAGDFAIATPGSTLLFHGGSIPGLHSPRAKDLSLMAHGMTSLNEKRAVSLARRSASRSMSLASMVRSTFDEVRAEAKNPGLSDLNCFQRILRDRLSPAGQQILKRSTANCGAYRGLLNCFRTRMRKVRSATRMDVQKAMLNASVAFELHTNGSRSNWSLSNGGLRRINDCFFFLDEFFGNASGDELGALSPWNALPNGAGPRQQSRENRAPDYFCFLPFFLAVGGALQVGENELTAMDAFWLGLIDTVRADPAVPPASQLLFA